MLVKDMNIIAAKNGTSIQRMRNEINRTIDKSTPELIDAGKSWYKSAHNECVVIANDSKYSVAQVAGAVAHLSPRMRWNKNIEYAIELIETGDTRCLSRSIDNAKRALSSDDPLATFSPTSFKTKNFCRNILNDHEPVTVDTWAARIALGTDDAEKVLNRRGMYQTIAHAYKLAGKDNGVTPAEAQAIAWCVVRGTHE